jgi:hypothetical protein
LADVISCDNDISNYSVLQLRQECHEQRLLDAADGINTFAITARQPYQEFDWRDNRGKASPRRALLSQPLCRQPRASFKLRHAAEWSLSSDSLHSSSLSLSRIHALDWGGDSGGALACGKRIACCKNRNRGAGFAARLAEPGTNEFLDFPFLFPLSRLCGPCGQGALWLAPDCWGSLLHVVKLCEEKRDRSKRRSGLSSMEYGDLG